MGGKATPATLAVERAGIVHRLHTYPVGDEHSYGEDAADALGVPRERVFKTLIATVDGTLTTAIVPVAGTLDLKALAAAAGGKRAAMAGVAAAQRATGYVRGGISPLGQRRRLPAVLDVSALDLPTVFVSAGRRGLQLEIAPTDLIALTGADTARIGR